MIESRTLARVVVVVVAGVISQLDWLSMMVHVGTIRSLIWGSWPDLRVQSDFEQADCSWRRSL